MEEKSSSFGGITMKLGPFIRSSFYNELFSGSTQIVSTLKPKDLATVLTDLSNWSLNLGRSSPHKSDKIASI